MLFGSAYPLITPERWMKDFNEAGFKDKVKPLILKNSAKRLRSPWLVGRQRQANPARANSAPGRFAPGLNDQRATAACAGFAALAGRRCG